MRRGRAAIDAVARAAPTLLAAAGHVPDGERRSSLVAARLCADLFGRASRRAEGPRRARSSMPTPTATAASCRPALAAIDPERAKRRLGAAPDRRQAAVRPSPGQGQRHLCRRRGIYRLEDQPPRRHRYRAQAVAEAASAAGGDQPAAAAPPIGRDPLGRRAKRAGDGAGQRADRERLAQQVIADQIVALALADIAGDEQHGDVVHGATSARGPSPGRSSPA